MSVGDVPDKHPSVAGPRGDESSVRREGDDEDGGLVASHQSDTVARHTVPQSEASVRGSGPDIITVWMEGQTVNIGEVSMEDPEGLALVRCPESGSSVMATRGKVVAVGGKCAVPDWEHVALVDHQTGPGEERPEPDCTVL